MPIINSIAAMKEEMTAWRRDIHAHPETAFEEERTADLVSEKLKSWGIEVHRGIAKTGVVGVLRGRTQGSGAIGLRADMDALPMAEETGLPYESRHPGKFHGCGHDGHTTMLLGAAKYLAQTRNFDGTVHFIFQPAEEGQGGGHVMVQEGLFERFPCDEVYGMHNWPDLPAGHVGIRAGPIMAATDQFDIRIDAIGGHAAMPDKCIDPVVIAAQVITAFQTLISRSMNPIDAGVISVTKIEAGSAYNVIPREALMAGTVRTFTEETRKLLRTGILRLAKAIPEAYGAKGVVTFHEGYPATVNHAEQTDTFADIAARVVGQDRVHRDVAPVMGGEDFSYMLEARPGAYLWLGQAGGASACAVHNPQYDFNDEILPIGASLFATLVETQLKTTG